MPRSEKSSLKSVGYAEKSEMQDLNSVLEGCLSEMRQLEEDTAEFEKRIAEMEAGAEAEVKKGTITLERKNQKLKDDHRREDTARDHMQTEQTEKERDLELLMAKCDSEGAKLAQAEAETEILEREIDTIASQIPDLRKELADKRKQNAELRKTLKGLEGSLAGASNDLTKKTTEAEGLGKKVAGLKDRLEVITVSGREAEQRHKFVITRLSAILSGGPGDLDGEWQMLKDALREEHELELSTLTEEKTEKWRFELNKMDNEIATTQNRVNEAEDRKRQVDKDLGAMFADRDALAKELEDLRAQLEAGVGVEAFNGAALDDLIKMYEDMLAKKESDCKRLAQANGQLEKANAKLEETLEDLREQVAAARLALAEEKVLYYKAIENIQNCADRKEAEEAELEDLLGRLKESIEGRAVSIKELNDELVELRQLELDIAGLRAEIDRYSVLLGEIPDPKKKISPGKRENKRRRTETGMVAVTPGVVKRVKVTKTKVSKSTTKKASKKKTVAAPAEDGMDLDLNDDGRITRSEARVFKAKTGEEWAPTKVADEAMGDIIIEEDLINSEGYTLLANLSDQPVDISAWKIKARIGRMQMKFPKGTVVQPGGNIYIWAKSAEKPPKGKENVVWKSREQTKGDDTDILELMDGDGKVVHRYSVA